MSRRRHAVIAIGAVAMVAVLVAGWLIGRPGSDSAADEPSATPSPTPSATPTGTVPVTPSAAPPSAPPTAATPSRSAARPAPGKRWAPTPGQAWQWQLTTPVDQSVDVPVYDIDGFENSAEVVRALHAKGRRVICYVEVGAAEDFRPDHGTFPKEVLGKPNGWEGERSVDIRRLDVLGPILAKRFDMCRQKGFDAVEPDLMENYAIDSGFPVTAADQLRFNRFVARLAHERGMAVALKNDSGQVDELVGDFDFAVVEECAEFDECALYAPFIKAGKAVLHVEYKLAKSDFCRDTKARGFSSMRKDLDLNAARQPC